MIYLAVALGVEAKPIIKYYNLKRDNEIKKVQVFRNEEIVLIITGVGILKSAISLSFILSKFDIKEDDIFINIGVCGSNNKFIIGDIVICNKIINSELKKSYYPDMIFKHTFKEGSLESFNTPVYSDVGIIGDIVDMEGAGLAEASSYFFKSYQINFIKIISDYLSNNVKSEDIENLIEKSLPKIDKWLGERKEFKVEKEIKFSTEEEKVVNELIEKCKFTATMKNELEDILIYYKLLGKDILNILDKYKELEIKDKRDSKRILEEIRYGERKNGK